MRNGIDIASHQHPDNAPIDWPRVAGLGIDWCAIKLTEGATYRNVFALSDVRGAQSNGIEVVGYHYAKPGNNDPIQEATNFTGYRTSLGGGMKLALDIEEMAGHSWRTLARWVDLFVTVARPDFIYWNINYRNHLLPHLTQRDFAEWIAAPSWETRPYGCAIWQRGQKPVPGIKSATVDQNVVFYDHPRPIPGQAAHGIARAVDPATAPTLRIGHKGEAVRRLQHLLNAHLPHRAVTGEYGKSTAERVIEFQRRRHIETTGRVDRPTWAALIETGDK